MTLLRIASQRRYVLVLAILVAVTGCKDRDADKVRAEKKSAVSDASATGDRSADGWRVKMSNDLLQKWILACGGATGAPTADKSEITVFLGDNAQGTKCTIRYTQASMEIHDIQLAVRGSDPQQAYAKLVEFADDILMPLLPPAVADRVRTDAVNGETYVSKRVGKFTVAMRSETDGTQTTRWLWIFRGSQPPPSGP